MRHLFTSTNSYFGDNPEMGYYTAGEEYDPASVYFEIEVHGDSASFR